MGHAGQLKQERADQDTGEGVMKIYECEPPEFKIGEDGYMIMSGKIKKVTVVSIDWNVELDGNYAHAIPGHEVHSRIVYHVIIDGARQQGGRFDRYTAESKNLFATPEELIASLKS